MKSLLMIIPISVVPVAAVFVWFKAVKVPLGLRWFALSLAAGILALGLSAFLQYLFFIYIKIENTMFVIFVRTALVEEAGRFLICIILFTITWRVSRNNFLDIRFAAAAGLVSALAFAGLESAWYIVDAPEGALLRSLAVPLHAACGARTAAAAAVRLKPARAFPQFVKSAVIHGFYNYFISVQG
ncbi:MAG: hypothetical protein LBD20_05075, partial [Spirochaetaceae bacterium]|nr:hypothetical protein [Spirochaetaceae bacterium]